MKIGEKYGIKIGGLQNPRYVVKNSNLPANKREYFDVTTYDSLGYDEKVNLIDKGSGGAIDIDKISQIASFSAEAFNTTNGVGAKYFVSFFSAIRIDSGDTLVINFPAENFLVPTSSGSKDLKCTAVNGMKAVSCVKKTDTQLEATFNTVT